jgi:hypothetical protein
LLNAAAAAAAAAASAMVEHGQWLAVLGRASAISGLLGTHLIAYS